MIALVACTAIPNELARPNRVALGPDGTVYVSDFHHDRIVVFGADDTFRGTFGEQGIGHGQLWRITALTFTRDGALLVANRRPETDERESATKFEVVRFVDGEEQSRIPLDGRTLQSDGWIDAMAEAANGNFIVADSSHGELVEIDAAGQRVGRYGGVPKVDAAPSALRRDGDTLWVVEQFRHRVRRVGPGGKDSELPLEDVGSGRPRFPSAIGLCPGRWVAIADFGAHRVVRYDLDGGWLGEIVPEPVGPDQPVQLMDLAVSGDCERLYLVDSKGNRVLITAPDGRRLGTLATW